jgi:hypothetical protein
MIKNPTRPAHIRHEYRTLDNGEIVGRKVIVCPCCLGAWHGREMIPECTSQDVDSAES